MDESLKIVPLNWVGFFELTKPIVQAHGCFDLLHAGHLDYLKAAKEYGTLVVTVTSDQYVNKGNNRPIINEQDRVRMVAALQCVDYVCLSDFPTACASIRAIKPRVFTKGRDYNAKTISVEEAITCEAMGAEIVYIQTPKQSTTEIIKRCKLA